MAKKAYLVEFKIQTRIIVETESFGTITNPQENASLKRHIMEKAEEEVANKSWNYINHDNINSVKEDKLCPYGTFLIEQVDDKNTKLSDAFI